MATTREEIGLWFEEGLRLGATHMIVLCDTYDHEDYPVMAYSLEQAKNWVKEPGPMQRVMEVYKLKASLKDEQMLPARNYRLE